MRCRGGGHSGWHAHAAVAWACGVAGAAIPGGMLARLLHGPVPCDIVDPMRTPDGYRKRLKHFDDPGHAHYLTFSCFRQQRFLKSVRACDWLVEAIGVAREEHPFDLWAWVFMPEHVHLLLLPHKGIGISEILSAIKVPVSKRAAGWVRREAPQFVPHMLDVQPDGRQVLRFWRRGGGYDRNIITPDEVREKIGYIHKNPMRRGLVASPAQWLWSSYSAWMTGIDKPLAIDRGSVPRVA
jgi:putative transposase